jgi:hypothetical protein
MEPIPLMGNQPGQEGAVRARALRIAFLLTRPHKQSLSSLTRQPLGREPTLIPQEVMLFPNDTIPVYRLHTHNLIQRGGEKCEGLSGRCCRPYCSS